MVISGNVRGENPEMKENYCTLLYWPFRGDKLSQMIYRCNLATF